MKKLAIIILTLSLFLIAACQYSNPYTQTTTTTTTSTPVTTTPTEYPILKTMSSDYGQILTDLNGMTLYAFLSDSLDVSNCNDGCSALWPPLIVPANSVPTGQGITGKLGVITRTDGTYQVTINNQPLYVYSIDKISGDIKGQGYNQKWYVVSTSGDKITKDLTAVAPSAQTPSTPSYSGGY
ncbi:MAG: hypothetical protein PHF86_05660 [Candidatus Nanoarchaeia archaeon]|nr:hypothetical protein [Candidatus Nanoarchaeia archaeon]